MSDGIDDIIKTLEDAKDHSNDAKNQADNSEGMIESAINLINDLQEEINKPKYCSRCQALIDLKK